MNALYCPRCERTFPIAAFKRVMWGVVGQTGSQTIDVYVHQLSLCRAQTWVPARILAAMN